MDAHVATMERFLTTQEQIMQLYLAEAELDGRRRYARAARLGRCWARSSAGPPGELLVARRLFDPAEDLYLRDHALGRAVSTIDPELSALMVMPLTMSLEILAEAAAFLVPGRVVTRSSRRSRSALARLGRRTADARGDGAAAGVCGRKRSCPCEAL